jgi:beta-glucanase (GH16 family)
MQIFTVARKILVLLLISSIALTSLIFAGEVLAEESFVAEVDFESISEMELKKLLAMLGGQQYLQPVSMSEESIVQLEDEPESSSNIQNGASPTSNLSLSQNNSIPITPQSQVSLNPTIDFEIDFSKLKNGTPVSSLFRVQNGIDDHWNPSWNNEKQMYRSNNVKIENGNLLIQAKLESNGEISSGKVDTQGFFDATYGKWEVVAKMPSGIGTFPAIWLLASANGSHFRNSVASASEKQNELSWQGDGEIDIMEFLGAAPDFVFHDAHTFNSLLAGTLPNAGEAKISKISDEFHTYAIDWKPDSITYSVDGKVTHKITRTSDNFRDWPFNKPFYLILNLAMGGNWNDDLVAGLGKTFPKGIDSISKKEWNMYIKSIRHFKN